MYSMLQTQHEAYSNAHDASFRSADQTKAAIRECKNVLIDFDLWQGVNIAASVLGVTVKVIDSAGFGEPLRVWAHAVALVVGPPDAPERFWLEVWPV